MRSYGYTHVVRGRHRRVEVVSEVLTSSTKQTRRLYIFDIPFHLLENQRPLLLTQRSMWQPSTVRWYILLEACVAHVYPWSTALGPRSSMSWFGWTMVLRSCMSTSLSFHCNGDLRFAYSDYITRFSGITAENYVKAILPLISIRASLDAFINSDTILIGHALDNDLKTLRMIHTKCVDTAILLPHQAGAPYRRALKDL